MRAFHPVHSVEWVKALEKAPIFSQRISKKKLTAARRAGLSYEKKVKVFLEKQYEERCIQGKWFAFSCNGGEVRQCQVDAAIFHEKEKIIVLAEIKLRHCALAWLQLQHLYKPVFVEAFPGWDIRMLEICRWYEPLGQFPVEVVLQPQITHIPPASKMGVYIYAPNRNEK